MSLYLGVCVVLYCCFFVVLSNVMYLYVYNILMNECMSVVGWKEYGIVVDGIQFSLVQFILKYNEMFIFIWVFFFLFVDEEKI